MNSVGSRDEQDASAAQEMRRKWWAREFKDLRGETEANGEGGGEIM